MNRTVNQAEEALESAKSAYTSELKRDIDRGEGSEAQERRREEHQRSLRDNVAQCERDLEVARKNAINELTEVLVRKMKGDISLLQEDALQASKEGDFHACKRALEMQAREINNLITLANDVSQGN
ncbi:hypothetical protein [Marinimicrobium sp. ABcell2]|uniref:hypothetical protein n=1 Tax=Marinimicrobium sp. ABcell2 TaxID=3069751 RepID=UPI0027B75993|nr:hypothetical protein [Marinimicrobium sp. ABcell2]MDQ2077565.1 hypothetical protein [Marinimicrobium sp. ABcell2]